MRASGRAVIPTGRSQGARMRASGRAVIPTMPGLPFCVIPVSYDAESTVRIDIMSCCVTEIYKCIAQGAAKRLAFEDAQDADFSGASEITFDVWEKNWKGEPIGSPIFSASLTGKSIILAAASRFIVLVGSASSLAMPTGSHHCEAWVTLSSGDRSQVGAGRFDVINTRKYDT